MINRIKRQARKTFKFLTSGGGNKTFNNIQSEYINEAEIYTDFFYGNHTDYIRMNENELDEAGQIEYSKRKKFATITNYCQQALETLTSFIYSKVIIRRITDDSIHNFFVDKVWKKNSQVSYKYKIALESLIYGHCTTMLKIEDQAIKYEILDSRFTWVMKHPATQLPYMVISYTRGVYDTGDAFVNEVLGLVDKKDFTYDVLDIYQDNYHNRWLISDDGIITKQTFPNEKHYKLNELFLFYYNNLNRIDNIFGGLSELLKIMHLNTRINEVNLEKDLVLKNNAFPLLISSCDLDGMVRSISQNTISVPTEKDWIRYLTVDTFLDPYFDRTKELKEEIFEAVGLRFIGRNQTGTGQIRGASGLDKLFSADTINVQTKQNVFSASEEEEIKTIIRFANKNKKQLNIDFNLDVDINIDIYFGNEVLDGDNLNSIQATILALNAGVLDELTACKRKEEYKDLNDSEILNIIKENQNEIAKQKQAAAGEIK